MVGERRRTKGGDWWWWVGDWSNTYQHWKHLTSGLSTPSHSGQMGMWKSSSQNFSSISISASGLILMPKLLSDPGLSKTKLSIAAAHCNDTSWSQLPQTEILIHYNVGYYRKRYRVLGLQLCFRMPQHLSWKSNYTPSVPNRTHCCLNTINRKRLHVGITSLCGNLIKSRMVILQL